MTKIIRRKIFVFTEITYPFFRTSNTTFPLSYEGLVHSHSRGNSSECTRLKEMVVDCGHLSELTMFTDHPLLSIHGA